MSDVKTASFPVNDGNGTRVGSLNCTVLRPTIGRAKQFRKRGRFVQTLADQFNAVSSERTAVAAALAAATDEATIADLEKKDDQLSAQLDDLDAKSYAAIVDQAKCTLLVASYTPAEGFDAPATTPTLDAVAWDDVEIPYVTDISGFFRQSIVS